MNKYKIDYSKIKTIEDVILILATLDLKIVFDVNSNDIKPSVKSLFDKGYLIKID